MRVPLLRQPSAALPLAMALTAVGVVLTHVAVYGIVHEADEGTAAHIWQLLMVAQVPLVVWFAVRWLPRMPGQALRVLGLQAAVVLASLAAVYWLT